MTRILIAVILPLLITSTGQCDWITGVTIEDVSSEFPTFGRVAVNTVNGSELIGDRHRATDGVGMWHTQIEDWDPFNDNFAHITFDLGDNYDLDQLKIWNYGETNRSGGVGYNRRGVKDFTISVASSENATDFTPIGDFELARANIPNQFGYLFEGEEFLISANNVRLVRFDISSSHFSAIYRGGHPVGLSEVRFSGNLSAVPEPSSLALFSLAGLGLFARRKRRPVTRTSLHSGISITRFH